MYFSIGTASSDETVSLINGITRTTVIITYVEPINGKSNGKLSISVQV